jgi:ethylmalonyl-CoA/methylmalonyl-CoA decarboxylase
MMVQLKEVVEELENWKDGKGVVLHVAGGSFCTGGDLNTMSAIMDPVKGARMSEFMQRTLNRLYCLPLLSVALVQGHALGGGAEIATACDFRMMDVSAKIGFVQSRMGVSPGWGGGMRLVQLVGRNVAMDILVSGRVLHADEALKLNLVCDVMNLKDPESGVDNAKAWLKNRLKGEPAVVQAAKKVVLNGMYMHNEELLKGERDIFTSVWGGPAHFKAVNSKTKHR